MKIEANLRHVIYALSDALDLVGIDDVDHGKRVGIMAAECGRVLGLPEDECTALFDLGMLHDIGVSSTETHRNLVGEFAWAGADEHCEQGYLLLRDFLPLAWMAEPVRHHHALWKDLVGLGLDPGVAFKANLIHMVDRADMLGATYLADNSVFMHAEEIRERIGTLSGSYFAPELVTAFLEASKSEAFWLALEQRSIQGYLWGQLSQEGGYEASLPDLKQLARIFSHIVDAKSTFTAEHSLGVANLSRLIGAKMGVSPVNCDKLEIAGLLHDLGKLRVPDEILDKPGRLDGRERQIISTHSFETYKILRNIKGFEEIAPWAAYHHEAPGGSGYPFRLKAEELALEPRILRAADIFQAMVQDRPYRRGLSGEAAIAHLRGMEAQGEMEGALIDSIEAMLPEAMAAALPSKARGSAG